MGRISSSKEIHLRTKANGYVYMAHHKEDSKIDNNEYVLIKRWWYDEVSAVASSTSLIGSSGTRRSDIASLPRSSPQPSANPGLVEALPARIVNLQTYLSENPCLSLGSIDLICGILSAREPELLVPMFKAKVTSPATNLPPYRSTPPRHPWT